MYEIYLLKSMFGIQIASLQLSSQREGIYFSRIKLLLRLKNAVFIGTGKKIGMKFSCGVFGLFYLRHLSHLATHTMCSPVYKPVNNEGSSSRIWPSCRLC